MKLYIRIFFMVMIFCMNKPVLAYDKYVDERERLIKNIQGILTLDKKKDEYKVELAEVNVYPQFNKKNIKSYSTDFHHYVKSLLPYMLKKVKNNDVNGEIKHFHELLVKAEDIDNIIVLSSIEKVSFDLCYESLKTEKILRACSHAISKYENKKLQMDVELDRFGGIVPNNLGKAANMASDYSSLRRSVSSIIED